MRVSELVMINIPDASDKGIFIRSPRRKRTGLLPFPPVLLT